MSHPHKTTLNITFVKVKFAFLQTVACRYVVCQTRTKFNVMLTSTGPSFYVHVIRKCYRKHERTLVLIRCNDSDV